MKGKVVFFGTTLTLAVLSLVIAKLGGAQVQVVPAFVQLQATTPGTPQTGNSNISGTAIAGTFSGSGSDLSNVPWGSLVGVPGSFPPSGSAGGDLTGTYPNPQIRPNTVEGIRLKSDVNSIVKVSGGLLKIQSSMLGIDVGNSPPAAKLDIGLSSEIGLRADSSSNNGTISATNSNPVAAAILGHATGSHYGVEGMADHDGGVGVFGISTLNTGFNFGGRFESASSSGYGLEAMLTNTGGAGWAIQAYCKSRLGTAINAFVDSPTGINYGVTSSVNSPDGWAGYFGGKVNITGTLSKGGGSFKIDHPLDKANKFLYHSFVESPDMKDIYDGVVTTDARGYATVVLPDWFQSLNQDFRYQVTVLDSGDSDDFVLAKVVRKIEDNRFTIRTSRPKTEVSWMVTGIRHDDFANAHRIPVEEEKTGTDRGRYLYPREAGLSKDRGIDYLLFEQKKGLAPGIRP